MKNFSIEITLYADEIIVNIEDWLKITLADGQIIIGETKHISTNHLLLQTKWFNNPIEILYSEIECIEAINLKFRDIELDLDLAQ